MRSELRVERRASEESCDASLKVWWMVELGAKGLVRLRLRKSMGKMTRR